MTPEEQISKEEKEQRKYLVRNLNDEKDRKLYELEGYRIILEYYDEKSPERKKNPRNKNYYDNINYARMMLEDSLFLRKLKELFK